ncbi:hypothetical protein J416_15667 [Gracilibacillus halophilus YIM-C55.5]|uniref:Uncharacterized protein n=1 Tax=Gracilibacillus halophilus YIM-C55.5 TaxID=1308866 RepID=N4WLZ0_9BACI|nr:hypothetical protein [Gracilibacillus halophilus]ENH95520.1 hypothetical protein J416_15667 [Gracilibacillus halophilus YIM-C55.5]
MFKLRKAYNLSRLSDFSLIEVTGFYILLLGGILLFQFESVMQFIANIILLLLNSVSIFHHYMNEKNKVKVNFFQYITFIFYTYVLIMFLYPTPLEEQSLLLYVLVILWMFYILSILYSLQYIVEVFYYWIVKIKFPYEETIYEQRPSSKRLSKFMSLNQEITLTNITIVKLLFFTTITLLSMFLAILELEVYFSEDKFYAFLTKNFYWLNITHIAPLISIYLAVISILNPIEREIYKKANGKYEAWVNYTFSD